MDRVKQTLRAFQALLWAVFTVPGLNVELMQARHEAAMWKAQCEAERQQRQWLQEDLYALREQARREAGRDGQ